MVVKVLGIEAKSGISKKSGKPYDGYFLYFAHEKQGVTGMYAGDTFLQRDFAEPKLQACGGAGKLPGKSLNIDYDNRGFLVNLSVV